MTTKKVKLIIPFILLITVLMFALLFTLFNFLGKSIPLYKDFSDYNNSLLSAKTLDRIIEDNKQTWRTYEDHHIYLEYPIHLSRFEKSDNDLFPDDALVSFYYRSSGDKNYYGRSFGVILYNTFPNTEGLDVKEWIYESGKNYYRGSEKNYNEARWGKRDEYTVTETQIGGKEAYSVKINAPLPRMEIIYYQTYNGIRAIGFYSSTSHDRINEKDYEVFDDILNTISFDK